MSINRWDVCAYGGPGLEHQPGGRFVEYADHVDVVAALEARVTELEAALRRLLADVQDYPAWQRPCDAVDKARTALAAEVEP